MASRTGEPRIPVERTPNTRGENPQRLPNGGRQCFMQVQWVPGAWAVGRQLHVLPLGSRALDFGIGGVLECRDSMASAYRLPLKPAALVRIPFHFGSWLLLLLPMTMRGSSKRTRREPKQDGTAIKQQTNWPCSTGAPACEPHTHRRY